MLRFLMVFLLILALVACTGEERPSDETVAPEPPGATTSTIAASPTTTTSLPAEVVPSGSDFVDEFEGGLDAAWRWVSEDPTKWSISTAPGALQIIATTAPGNPPRNLLLRPAPGGDYEITTLLRFAPTSNFQFAGLTVYSDPTSFLQLGRAYCDVENLCVGDGIYFDSVEQNQPTGENFAFTVRTADDVHLRLVAEGDTYTGYYSNDGEAWVTIGSHTRVLTDRQVGLLAGQTEVEIVAEFEYFRLISDEPVEPTEPIDSSLPSYTEMVAQHWAGIELCKTQAGISGGPDAFEFSAFGDEAPVISIREGYPSGFCPGARYIVAAELVLTSGSEFPVGTLLTLDSDLGFVAVSSWE